MRATPDNNVNVLLLFYMPLTIYVVDQLLLLEMLLGGSYSMFPTFTESNSIDHPIHRVVAKVGVGGFDESMNIRCRKRSIARQEE